MSPVEVIPWAVALVRACEDHGLVDLPLREAHSALRDVEHMARYRTAFSISWTRADVERLHGWAAAARRMGAAAAYRMGNDARARAYEAIVAVRMLAADVAEKAPTERPPRRVDRSSMRTIAAIVAIVAMGGLSR